MTGGLPGGHVSAAYRPSSKHLLLAALALAAALAPRPAAAANDDPGPSSLGKTPSETALLTTPSRAPLVATPPRLATQNGRPLTLDDVLASVRDHHPRIAQSLAGVDAAEAAQLRARGGFDPVLSAAGAMTTNGYYELRRGDVELRQPTPLWGAEFYSGYRIGRGLEDRYPTYYSDQTLLYGEVRAGVRVPLWRDRSIDAARAELKRTQEGLRAAESQLANTELEMSIEGARAYWQWVAAGQRAAIARDLLRLAEERDLQLQRRAESGAVASFDVVDNRRMVLERTDLLISAQRALEQAAFRLSLFLRDNSGRSVLPARERVPEQAPELPPPGVDGEGVVARVLACHPAITRTRAELAALRIDRELADNRVAPELNARAQVSRDLGPVGSDLTLPGTIFDAGVTFSIPLLLRSARGQEGIAEARMREKQQELTWLEDRTRADLLDAASRLRAAVERAQAIRDLVGVSEQLAAGERRRFDLGEGQLLFVNLREQSAADAGMRYADLAAAARLAEYEWRQVSGVDCAR